MSNDRIGLADEIAADFIEAGCIAVYGKNWNGPDDKRPGEPMKRVWRELVAKAQAPVLAALRQTQTQAPDREAGERMRGKAPEGFALVPLIETMAMLSAGQTAWLADPCKLSSTLYRAMVAAAPPLPSAQEGKPSC